MEGNPDKLRKRMASEGTSRDPRWQWRTRKVSDLQDGDQKSHPTTRNTVNRRWLRHRKGSCVYDRQPGLGVAFLQGHHGLRFLLVLSPIFQHVASIVKANF